MEHVRHLYDLICYTRNLISRWIKRASRRCWYDDNNIKRKSSNQQAILSELGRALSFSVRTFSPEKWIMKIVHVCGQDLLFYMLRIWSMTENVKKDERWKINTHTRAHNVHPRRSMNLTWYSTKSFLAHKWITFSDGLCFFYFFPSICLPCSSRSCSCSFNNHMSIHRCFTENSSQRIASGCFWKILQWRAPL